MSAPESGVGNIISETIAYSLAELHVHGILAGVALLFHGAVGEDVVAIVILGSFVSLAIVHHIRVRRGLKKPYRRPRVCPTCRRPHRKARKAKR